MRSLPLALLVTIVVAPAAAQVFPGDVAPPPAFPTALTVAPLAGFGGSRATRRWTDITDPDCDTVPCASKHSVGGSLGLAARFQMRLSPRVGLRFGVSYSAPHQKVSQTEPTRQTRIGDRVSVTRGEAMLLFRLKRQVPVFFGAGLAMATFSPGPVFGQDGAVEFGTVFVVGIDRQVTRRIGTRAEWTVYLMRPSTDLFSSEYRATGLAFDNHVSFGAHFLLIP
jgi:hypothetical protein